jgi:hypothetical protein
MKLVGVNLIVRNLKYLSVVSFNWMYAGPGDGTPPLAIRRAMTERGEDWHQTLPGTSEIKQAEGKR